MRLKGKTALVTAAGQGIGRASALAMAAEGAQVWATDLNPKLLATYEGVAGVKARAAGRAGQGGDPGTGGRDAARSTSCSIARVSCTTAPSCRRPTRSGTSPST